MQHQSDEMRACIEACLAYHTSYLGMAMNHCLEEGGRHVAPGHLKLMIACAEMCQVSANFMSIGTPLHKRTCSVCAEVCEACAGSCEGLDGMEDCAAACRRCAESCRRMAA